MNYWGLFFSFVFLPTLISGGLIVMDKIERRDYRG